MTQNLLELQKISVIIPTYNVEKYIRQCLDSVVNQTYGNLEIIIIDDCSKDSTPQIIKEYAEKDSRIRTVFHTENAGPGRTRNEGVYLASGEYIAFVDHDDWQDLTKYEKMMIRAIGTDADITVCCADEYNMIENKTSTMYIIPDEWEKCYPNNSINIKSWYAKDLILNKSDFSTFGAPWVKIIKSDLIKKYKIKFSEQDVLYDDILFQYLSIIHAEKIAFVNEVLYTHRLFDESITGKQMIPSRKNLNIFRDIWFDIIKTWNNLEKHAIEYNFLPRKYLILYFRMFGYFLFNVYSVRKYWITVKSIIEKYNLYKTELPKYQWKYYNYFVVFPFWKLRSRYFSIRIRPRKKEYKIILFGKRIL